MPLLTTINNIPLYSTIEEALGYAASNGLTGYHTHQYQGQTGYMGGRTHIEAVSPQAPPVAVLEDPTPQEQQEILTGESRGGTDTQLGTPKVVVVYKDVQQGPAIDFYSPTTDRPVETQIINAGSALTNQAITQTTNNTTPQTSTDSNLLFQESLSVDAKARARAQTQRIARAKRITAPSVGRITAPSVGGGEGGY